MNRRDFAGALARRTVGVAAGALVAETLMEPPEHTVGLVESGAPTMDMAEGEAYGGWMVYNPALPEGGRWIRVAAPPFEWGA